MATEQTIVDSKSFRVTHNVHGISKEECEAWLRSPITKALIERLGSYCIICGVQFGESDTAVLHFMGPFDIRRALIERSEQP